METTANVFQFQGSKMNVSAKGPNINKKFTMNTSIRPNLLSSTMNMPQNFEKQRSAPSVVSSQRSIYYQRDTSRTASICGDLQLRNFHQPVYPSGHSQRSVYNDRAVSPVSMRSIDSTASRADIAIAAIDAANHSCTDDEWAKIWHLVNRTQEFRKRAIKRRKMKMFLKKLDVDEAEQGSCSSISNDDCASTRTGYSRRFRYDPYHKESNPQSVNSYDCRSEDMYRSNNRGYSGYARSESHNPYQVDKSTYRPSSLLPYQKTSQFGSMYSSQNNGSQNNTLYGPRNTFFSQRCMNGQANMSAVQKNTSNSSMCSWKSMQSMPLMSQRDRFRGEFQFPSQKFNRSTLYEEQEQVRNIRFPLNDCANRGRNLQKEHIDQMSDESDDIFLDTTVKPKTLAEKSGKRKAESVEDMPNSTKKKLKVTADNNKAKKQTPKRQAQNKGKENNEFEFVKPQLPVRKTAPAKPQEKMISKSTGAPDLVFAAQEKEKPLPQPVEVHSPEPDVEPEPFEDTQLTNSDLSMRPSFIKRKLFTQTLDVTERKNNSFESGGTDSPQNNIYSALSREKHKTRKLVTSQSLLSRDVNQDDDNLLDLIHKIVPQVNSTMTANNSKPRVSGAKDADDKWDITSLISTCNNDSVSETYTDDEIFQVGVDKKSNPQQKPVTKKTKSDDNKVADGKLELSKVNSNVIKTNNKKGKGVGKLNLKTHSNGKDADDSGPTNNQNVKGTGNINLVNNDTHKECSFYPKSMKNNKDVANVIQTNKQHRDDEVLNPKSKKNLVNIHLTNNQHIKDFDTVNTKSKKNNKDVANTNFTNKQHDTDVDTIDTKRSKNVKDIVNVNPLNNKHNKDTVNTNNKISKDIPKKVVAAAPRMDTPLKLCPEMRAVLSRRRVDAFWDTDASEPEGEPEHEHEGELPLPRVQDSMRDHAAGQAPRVVEIQSTSKSTNITETKKTHPISPLVVLTDIKKDSRNQRNKKVGTKTEAKTSKKTKGGETSKKNNSGDTKSDKLDKHNKDTPTTSVRTRRQINLSAMSDNISDLVVTEKENLNPSVPIKGKGKKHEKLEDQKNHKTKTTTEAAKSRNRRQNDSLQKINNSTKRVEAPKSQKQTKAKLHKPTEQMDIDICKVLRSRTIDLSSSFNSDKFELTMYRARTSRTPSKRISFNTTKNMLPNNKIRGRGNKA